jgi:hypothetical protein
MRHFFHDWSKWDEPNMDYSYPDKSEFGNWYCAVFTCQSRRCSKCNLVQQRRAIFDFIPVNPKL